MIEVMVSGKSGMVLSIAAYLPHPSVILEVVGAQGRWRLWAHKGDPPPVHPPGGQDVTSQPAFTPISGLRGSTTTRSPRSFAIARDTVLLTVPMLMPSVIAISGSVMSS